ncbi:PAS domain S-box protein [Geomonas sp. RF6]|uniref:PAS domain S-box protein n=1 Tax=Geomonas sp. RF6 TaxID=2897342 RepID=UPI001E3FE641|nr:PAS domain S-box protein [Geomonas sp. RF6]UFS70892.1 PAS domain S-box protein [Geomonas sp. RF6]
MKFNLKFRNNFVVNIVVASAAIIVVTLLFLAYLRSEAIRDANLAQEVRIRTLMALLMEKGDDFHIEDGVLKVGKYPLDGNTEMVDRIQAIFGGTATIFKGDIRVATSVLLPDGRRAVGTRLTGPAYDAIFKKEGGYRGETLVLGEEYFTAYDPLRDRSGRIIGAIYVGERKDEFFSLYNGIKLKVVLTALVLILGFSGFSLLLVRERKGWAIAVQSREKKMLAILNNIPDSAWLKDEESRFIAVNEPFAKAVGLPHEEIVGKTDYDLWPLERAEANLAEDQQVLATARRKELEERVTDPSGEERWLETVKTPIFDRNGEVAGTTGISRDITARRRAEEELRFTRFTVDRAADAICWVEEDGQISYANCAAGRYLGASRSNLLAMSVFEVVPEYTRESWADQWEVLRRTGSMTFETSIRATGGALIPVEVSANYLTYNDRARNCLIIRDISERRRFEQKNRETLSILSATLESTADGILVVDLNKHVVMRNRKFEQIFNLTPQMRASSDYRAFLKHLQGQLKDPDPFIAQFEEESAHPERESSAVAEFRDGRIVEIFSSPHRIEERVVGQVLSFRDVTLQRKMENRLRSSQKVEALGTLTGGIAHDFNNIMTAIIGYGSMALENVETRSEAREHLELLLSSAERASQLTQGLLAYSRKQSLAPAVFDLNELVLGVERFVPQMTLPGIELSVQLSRETPHVLADRAQIEQVLLNLIANARDAMAGPGKIVIATGTAHLDDAFIAAQGYGKSGEYAILSVSDTGSGMDARTLERIFEPFFTTKEVGKGTGLGLSIAFGTVKQHGGFINAFSERGQGSTFWIYLPLSAERVAADSCGEAPAKGKGETILLIEDNREVRSLFREVLARNGYEVIEAINGADGVAKFRERGADVQLLVIDVVMPLKNGKEAYQEICKMRGDVKAIFTSGYTDDLIDRKGLMEQGLRFIPKPVSPARLLAELRQMLD